MANAITYLGNVGRSIAYSAVDEVKNLNPALTSFMETNADTTKSVYSSIKNLKTTAKRLSTQVMESDYADLGKDLLSNIKEDISSGNFYNKQRIDKAEQAAADAFLDISDFDIDDGTGGLDDLGDDDNDSSSSIADTVGQKTSTAIANIMVGTSEYTVAAMHADNKALYDQNKALYSTMYSGMKTINENIAGVVEFMSGPMQNHLENSKLYYETTTQLQTEQTEILKEIRDLYKSQVQPEKSKTGSKRTTMFDILDSEGMPNLETYFKAIKENINDMTSGTVDMMQTMFNKDTLGAMIASPLQTITDTLVKTVIPKTLKGAMKDLNASLSGAFSSAMANLNNVDEIDHPILGFLKNIFGVKPNEKSKFDNSKYTKDAIPFDGVTKHAIVNVIPTYLAEILEAVGGKGSRYDYESGAFISKEGVKKRKERMTKNAISQANMSIDPYLNAYKQKLKFSNDEERNQFEKDLEAILAKSFKDGKLFNYRAGGDAASYGLKGGKRSDINLEIIRSLFAKIPNSAQLRWANDMYTAKDGLAKKISNAEGSGYDIIGYATDGSMDLQGNKVSTTKSEKAPAGRKAKKKASKTSKVKESAKEASDNINSIDTEKMDKMQAKAWAESKLEEVDNDDLYGFGTDKKPTLTDKIMGAEKISEKAKLLYKNIDEILHKPTDLLAGMIKKADQSIYDLIFGKEKTDKDISDKGIATVILDKLKERMDAFSKWIDKKLIEPITKKINKENFDKAARKVFDFFGGDYDNFAKNMHDKFFGNKNTGEKGKFGDFVERAGNEVKGAGKFAANSVKDAAEAVNLTSKLNEAGSAKKEKNSKIDKILDDLGAGSIENAASGMKRVTKTGVVAVSEGEMIVPPDKNPNNIKSRLKKENAAKDNYINYFGDAFGIPNYALGGEIGKESKKSQFKVVGDSKDSGKKRIKPKSFAKNLINGKKTIDDFNELDEDQQSKVIENLKGMKEDLTGDDYEEGRDKSLLGKSLDEFKNAISATAKEFKRFVTDKDGKEVDQDKEEDNITKTLTDQIKNFFPEMTGGALLGTGISLATGLVGGPLLGAALGAATSLVKHSDKVQDMLFGKKVTDENGNTSREGSKLISKDLANNIDKYLPGMAKGATVGSILSIMPFVPGGPIAGMILGAGAGFALKSEKVHNAIFGEGKMLEGFDKKVKDALPKMGAGALVGLLAGPFSLVPNLLIGSAVGFATSTDKFQDMFFGEIDEKTGKRKGGLIKKITDTAIKPVIDFAKDQANKLGNWANKHIREPLARAVDPLKKQVQIMFKSITGHIKNAVDNFFEKRLGAPVSKWIKQKLFGGLGKLGKKLFGGVGKFAGGIISAPFRAIGGIGDGLRSKQVNTGNADYMSAEQRLVFRDSKRFNRKGKFRLNEDQVKMDQYMKGLSSDQASDLAEKLKGFAAADKKIDAGTDDAYKNFNDKVRNNDKIGVKETNQIAKQIKALVKKGKGTPKQISAKVGKIVASIPGLSEQDRKEIMDAANNFISTSVDARDRKNNIANDKSDAMGKLAKEMGINGLDEKELEKLIKNLEAESKFKKTKEDEVASGKEDGKGSKAVSDLPELNEEQRNRHTELINELEKIYQAITPELHPNQDKIDKTNKEQEETQDGVVPDIVKKTKEKEDKKKKKQEEKDRKKQLKKEYKEHEEEKTNFMDVSAAKKAREEYGEPDNRSFFGKAIDKIVSAFKGESSGDLDPSDGKTVTQVSPLTGGIIRLRKNKDGELDQDTSDSDTKETMKQQGILSKAIAGIPLVGTAITGMSGLFSKMSDKLFGNKEDGKEGIFSKLASKLFGDDGVLSGIFNFITGSKAGTAVKSVLSNVTLASAFQGIIAPALLLGGFNGVFDGFFKQLGETKLLKGDDTEGSLQDNRSATINGKQLAVDNNGNYIKNENGEFQTTEGEYVSGDIKTQGSDTRFSTQLKKNLVNGIITKGGSVTTQVAKGSAKALNKISGGTLGKAADAAMKNGVMGSVAKLLEKIPKILTKIPFLPKSVANNADTLVKAIYTHLNDAVGKLAESKLGIIAKNLGKALLAFRIIYVVGKGIDAWGNAESILGITQEATTTQRVIAVLIAVLNALIPVIGDLIPNKVLVNIFMEIAPKLGLDVSSLEEQRKAAEQEVAAYNEENGTDLSIEEYNEMNGKAGIITKAKNGIKSAITNIKEKGVGKAIADSKPGQYVLDKVNTFKQGLEEGGVSEAVASTLDSILPGPLGDIAGNIARISGMAWKGDVSGVFKAKLIDTKDDKKENFMTKLVNTSLGTVVKLPSIPIAFLSKGVHTFIGTVTKVFTTVKGYVTNTLKNIKQVHDDTETILHDPDSTLKDFFNFDKYTDEDGNPLGGITKAVMVGTRLATSGVMIVKAVGKKIWGAIKGVATTVVKNVKSVGENHVTLMAKAAQGDVAGIWNYSAEDNEDSPVNGFVKGTLIGSKLLTTIPALIAKAGIAIWGGIKSVATKVKDNVMTAGSNVVNIKQLSDNGDISGVWSYEAQEYEDSPVNGFVKGVTFASKLAFTVPTLIHMVGNNIADWITPKIDASKQNSESVSKAGDDLKAFADNGDVKSIMNYKGATLNTADILTPFRVFQLGIQKIFYTVIGSVHKLFGGAEKLTDKFKEKGKELVDTVSSKITDNPITNAIFEGAKKLIAGSGSAVADKINSFVASGTKDGTFISQLDSKYANKKFNVAGDTSKQTLGDTGCGPASAAMVINGVRAQSKQKMITMDKAVSDARKYKVQNSGVSADYFADEFKKNGLQSEYITDNDAKKRNTSILTHLRNGHQVVLMGQDESNTSKKNSPFGPNAHYIVANKISKDGKFIWVNDPESKKPNVKYSTSRILGSTQMGVAGYAASGSRLPLMTKLRNRFVARGITLVGSSVNDQVFNFFIDAGFTPEAAAAAVGNLCNEAGMDSSGNMKINSTQTGGEGVGIVQWSGGRKTQFINFCQQNGDPWPGTSLGTQLAFVKSELGGVQWSWPASYGYDTKYKITYDDFITCSDVELATGAWCANYERCKYANSHLDRRIAKAIEVYNTYSGKHVAMPDNISDVSGGTTTSDSDSASSGNVITDAISAINIFDKLAEAYGISSSSDSSSSVDSSNSDGTTSPLTSGGTTEQNALVDKMMSVKDKLAYSMTGPRDPDQGSADCSSTVEWAYKNVLGVDPGNYTGAMATDSDLYTVTTSLDPSKFQPGDILLYNKKGTNNIGHVEMYAGDNKTIGHGGGKNGTTPGPTVKDDVTAYRPNDFAMARRWVGFQNASGSGLDPNNMRGPKSVLYYKPKNASGSDMKPSDFIAAGSGLGTVLNVKRPVNVSTDVKLTDSKSSSAKSENISNSRYLATMISLLNSISSNTSNISSIVNILTKIAEIQAKEGEIDNSTEEGKKKSKELANSKKLLLATLKNSASGNESSDPSMDELLRNVDAIIKM